MFGPLLPGQTAIDDLSGLRLRKIRTVAELNAAESENIRRAMVRYLTARPSPRLAAPCVGPHTPIPKWQRALGTAASEHLAATTRRGTH